MLTYAYVVYPWLMLIDKIDGKDARLSENEARILCFFHSFYRNNLPIHPTKTQIAEALFLRVESGKTQPSTIRRALKGLQDKGYISVTEKGNSKGKANCYEFCPGHTLWDLFQIVDKENPGALSEGQRQIAKADLSPVASQASGSRDNVTGKEVKEPMKPATKKVEKKQAKASVPTVDANNWENREEDIKKQTRHVWDNHYKKYLAKGVVYKLSQVRDALRGQEAEDCRNKRPDKYWNIAKIDLECINWMMRSGLKVVADTGEKIEYYNDLPVRSSTDNYFKNIKEIEIEKNGKTFKQFQLIE